MLTMAVQCTWKDTRGLSSKIYMHEFCTQSCHISLLWLFYSIFLCLRCTYLTKAVAEVGLTRTTRQIADCWFPKLPISWASLPCAVIGRLNDLAFSLSRERGLLFITPCFPFLPFMHKETATASHFVFQMNNHDSAFHFDSLQTFAPCSHLWVNWMSSVCIKKVDLYVCTEPVQNLCQGDNIAFSVAWYAPHEKCKSTFQCHRQQ